VAVSQGRDVTHDDVKDAILQLTVTEHYYTGVQDLVTLLCEFNDISVKVLRLSHHFFTLNSILLAMTKYLYILSLCIMLLTSCFTACTACLR